VAPNSIGSRPADDRAEHDHRDDRVVGVPEHGDEVRDEVEGDREVREQEPQANARAARDVPAHRQVLEQPQRVREQPHRFLQERTARARDEQRRHE
jgi:hypothetical protein